MTADRTTEEIAAALCDVVVRGPADQMKLVRAQDELRRLADRVRKLECAAGLAAIGFDQRHRIGDDVARRLVAQLWKESGLSPKPAEEHRP